MTSGRFRQIIIWILLFAAAGLGWVIFDRVRQTSVPPEKMKKSQSAPVAVAPVEHGPIALRRTFSGALEASASFIAAPKVGGRVERIKADIGDTVKKGQVVARLDGAEFEQAVMLAKADLAVARANLTEAKSALTISNRELSRVQTLKKRGVASDSQLDAARADHLAKQARLKVAQAQVTRAEALLASAEIRLGYTDIIVNWHEDDPVRFVAERFVDEGETVTANTPLLSIIRLDPVTGILFVSEKDYGRLSTGQSVTLTTDAWPGTPFIGHIERIAPVFRRNTRQARVELRIPNSGPKLKPGMFIRASITLKQMADAVIIPEPALASRNDKTGVFRVNEDGKSVSWIPVTPGIREGNRLQVMEETLSGRVVVLGQQLLDDGSLITIPEDTRETHSETSSETSSETDRGGS